MKPLITFAIALLFQIVSFGQNGFIHKAEAKNEVFNGLKQGKWIEYLKFNAAWISQNDGFRECNKDTADYYRLAIYKDNQISGTEHMYYVSGEIMSEFSYNNGLKNGVAKSFYKSGNLMLENSYLDGLQRGLSKMYHENGKLYTEMLMINGVANGAVKTYYETGIILSEMLMINGKINGTYKQYNQSGILMIEMFYLDNKATGETKFYNEMGVLYGLGYNDSLGNPVYRTFNTKTGNLQIESFVEKGLTVTKMYYDGGQLQMISYQKDGKLIKQKTFVEKRKFMSETDRIAFDKERSEKRMEFWNDVSDVITTGIQLIYEYNETTLPTTLEEATDQLMFTIQEMIPND